MNHTKLENNPEQKKMPFRVCELSSPKEKNRHVYRMSDGTMQAVYTASFAEYDPDELDDAPASEEDGKHYRQRRPGFTARFSREEENDELFSVERGEYRVTVSAKKKKRPHPHGTLPVRHENALVFKGVKDGTDYEYTVLDDGVKENILIKKPVADYSYRFLLQCQGLRARLSEDATRVSFVDGNETEIFHIPAPFMTDAKGACSYAVSYALYEDAADTYTLTVMPDNAWLNSPERVFPVTVDPQIKLTNQGQFFTYSWQNNTITGKGVHVIGKEGTESVKRMYMHFEIPTLPNNPRIKKAELVLHQNQSGYSGTAPLIGLYPVTNTITAGNYVPTHSSSLIDYAAVRPTAEGVCYRFDLTSVFDAVQRGEALAYTNLVLKLVDENAAAPCWLSINGSYMTTSNAPEFVLTYESSYATDNSYPTHTHELGRFGRGAVDLQCGNLMLESEDFAWAGNLRPITIKHLYNSALADIPYTAYAAPELETADFSAMKVGNGFRLNLMQSMVVTSDGYVQIDENGTARRFVPKEQDSILYVPEDGGDAVYDSSQSKLTDGSVEFVYDTAGRLWYTMDECGNFNVITYENDRIVSVKDAVERTFTFEYNANGQLQYITAPDGTYVTYGYTGDLLTSITYPGAKFVRISYTAGKPSSVILENVGGNTLYRVDYTYNGNRVASVTEYDGNGNVGAGSSYAYSAAASRTVVTTTEQADTGESASNVIKTTYIFDDDGNIISEYTYSADMGNMGSEGSPDGINPYTGKGFTSNSSNLLLDHSFDRLDNWTTVSDNDTSYTAAVDTGSIYSKFGTNTLRIATNNENSRNTGVSQTTVRLYAGEYTFSAYLRVPSSFEGTNAGAFLRVTDSTGEILGVSERLSAYDGEHIRLTVPFTVSGAFFARVQILVNGKGTVYVDGAQLEKNPYATDYNLLENSEFEHETSGWTLPADASFSQYGYFGVRKGVSFTGSLTAKKSASQAVPVYTAVSTRETFTLSGWAKGNAMPSREREGAPQSAFELRAEIKYADDTVEAFSAPFSPGVKDWQFASVQFAKSKYKRVKDMTVYCSYDYNPNGVYFDTIALRRDRLETDLSASDFETETENASIDTVGAGTHSESGDTAHAAPRFSDATLYGNPLTETTYKEGEFGTIYRAFEYSLNGNDLIEETDPRGGKTYYTVNAQTSRNEEVTDRLGNKTAYEYDVAGRTTKVTSKKANGEEIAHVSYAYDAFDNMTEIVRGDGMKYVLAYNAFHNLDSIGIEGKTEKLIKYTYKNGNGRLKEMEYANGDRMKATYNSIGQMVGEQWLDTDGVETARYKYVYDGEGNIVRSIDFTAQKEYNYMYEDGNLVYATEADILVTDDVITSKTVAHTVRYCYDSEGNLVHKRIQPAGKPIENIYYEKSEDNTAVKFYVGNTLVTSHSGTDSFGRKTFDELQLGTGFLSRRFEYHAGEVTQAHIAKKRLKSSPTTQLVSKITHSDGRTFEYEYDAEERITSVVETYTVDDTPVTNTTIYTYDALGQLLTERRNGHMINSMTYDTYGNILSKNGVAYTYGNSVWKDLLTSYNGQSITYDAQGNPTSYLGHTLTWEKGRQLKSYDSNTYTYNANGIRTSKTVNGVKHTYTLDGTKILRETWSENTLIPLYDNEDSVCGILYNNIPYYFIKNLQGDVIAIVDKDANNVAKYSYDAWGKVLSVTDSAGTEITDASHVASINPFRYRGYYYDVEIGLYYLQSRYYDAVLGRFVNGDEVECCLLALDAKELNLFAYCANTPTIKTDPFGYWYISLVSLGRILLAFGVNPIATILIAWGMWKLKTILIAKYTALLAKLGSFWGPVVQAVVVVAGALLGVPTILDFAEALWDCIMQRKKGLEFTFKKTWFGMPYALDFYPV